MDLFDQFDCLFRHEDIDNPPHPFVLNKFLASDKDFAEFAKELVLHTWDPAMTWAIWKCTVPLMQSAPRLRYTAAKKPPAAEALVVRIVAVEAWKRGDAEFLLEVATEKELEALYVRYGVESPG